MSNQLYPSFREALLRAFFLSESFANDVALKVVLVGDGYTYNASHRTLEDLSDIVAPGVVIPSVTISPSAVVDAPDMVPAFTGLTTGLDGKAVIIYAEDTVTLETQLVGYADVATDGSLPFVLSQEELIIRWPPSGIFGI